MNFLKTQKQSSKIIRSEKPQYDKRRLTEIESDFTKNNTRNFHRTFREIMTGYQPPNLCFRRPDGTLETNTKNNCDILAKYFEKLLNTEPPMEELMKETSTYNPDSEPSTLDEVKEIIKLLKNRRAPGEDGIIAKIWKLQDPELTKDIHRILEDTGDHENS